MQQICGVFVPWCWLEAIDTGGLAIAFELPMN